MMKKNGFTLIELIALLGIIAIIILISAPSLINQIESQNEKKYNNFVNDLCLASETYINHHNIQTLQNTNDFINVPISELINNGYLKSNVTNPKTKQKVTDIESIKITLTSDKTYICELNG